MEVLVRMSMEDKEIMKDDNEEICLINKEIMKKAFNGDHDFHLPHHHHLWLLPNHVVDHQLQNSKVCKYSRFSSLLPTQNRDFLLPPTDHQNHQVKVSDLEDKIVALYFSANWYNPCREFTSVLTDVYKQLKDQNPRFEIIFVSSDENIDAFNSYRSTMPWLAIPFSDLKTKKALNRRFNIEGIPSLIILQPIGNDDNDEDHDSTIMDGVELIYRYGVRAFPFTKERLRELEKEEKERHENQSLVNLLTNHNRDFLLGDHPSSKQVKVSTLLGKTIGLYFSAKWCIPAQKFTPKLISIYHKIRQMLVDKDHEKEKTEESFQVVFISTDRNHDDFNSYFKTMPWLALPYGDPTIKNLTKYFDIQRIPCLVIIGTDGKTLTKQGRNLINLYSEKAYPFTKNQVKYLEKMMDEEAKNLRKVLYHSGHRHELTLVSEGNGGGPFICCDCEEQGLGWAYQCIECGYEIHPKCVKIVNLISSSSTD